MDYATPMTPPSKLKKGDNPEDPTLKLAQAALAKTPTLTRNFIKNVFSTSNSVLDSWVAHGWIKFLPKPANAENPWGKTKWKGRCFDINTVRINK